MRTKGEDKQVFMHRVVHLFFNISHVNIQLTNYTAGKQEEELCEPKSK